MKKTTLLAACLLLGLAACSTNLQVYSSPQHDALRLADGDLGRGGIAFLTPSTATGQEEDRQALAYVFAHALQRERPDIRQVSLANTISAVNRAGLADTYRLMYRDYRDTGVFRVDTLREVAKAAGVRYLAQLQLAHLFQGARGRFSALGLNVLNTQYANLRVFFQIWDSRDGSIAWEGADEVTFAIDTNAERPIAFRAIAERAAVDLIQSLP